MKEKFQMYQRAIEAIKAITYDIMLGCENFGEFEYLRVYSTVIINTVLINANNGVKTNWVELFEFIDNAANKEIDAKLVEIVDDYKIGLMEMFKDMEEEFGIE